MTAARSTAAQVHAAPCVKCGRKNPERCHYVSCPKWDDAIAQPAPAVTPLARSLAGAQSEKRLGADHIKPVFKDVRASWEIDHATHAREFDPRFGSTY